MLKGGVNLRYFFDSVRYSEDIDLDVDGIAVWALAEKVDAVLESPALSILLRTARLSVAGFTKPKQSETTQRWKVTVAVAGRHRPVRIKIEFSRRDMDTRFQLEPVPARVVEPYATRAPTIQHYLANAASEQKVSALAQRTEAQARDVFDLDLLLRARPLARGSLPADTLTQAAGRALELPFDAFRDQVLAFIDPEVADLYRSPQTWREMQRFVVDRLLDAR